jgi:enediyne polyketide synthase
MAQRHGLQLALVGSSATTPGDEVSATLQRCQQGGVKARYYTCDMGDATAVRALVAEIRQAQGTPRAVVHGAGRNSIRMAQDMDATAALSEMGPKVLGAHHLLTALRDQPPELVVGLTSIIGVTGMPGNAWYAFANAVLDLLLARFHVDHPGTQVASLAYSVWDAVGMGARMGSVKKLGALGIEAIPMADGVQHFLNWFDGTCGVRQPVITARPGKLPTWPGAPLAPPAPLGRFVEEELWGSPGVELTARNRLTPERDPYVLEHNFHGSLLFPTVFGLEAMAQVATVLTGRKRVVRLEEVKLMRPIVVNAGHGTRIDVCAAIDPVASTDALTVVRCEIRCEASGFGPPHFSARLTLAETLPALEAGVGEVVEEGRSLGIEPKTDLYGGVLFQGERFRKIESINAYADEDLVLISHSSVAGHGDDVWVLGDPYLRDAQLQSMQLLSPRDEQLPVFIGRIDLGRGYDAPGKRVLHTVYRKLEGKTHCGEVTVQDADGQVVERLVDYQLRIMSHDPARPDMRALLAPTRADDQVLQGLLSGRPDAADAAVALVHHPQLPTWSSKERREWERGALLAAAMQYVKAPASAHDFEVSWSSEGQPHISHRGRALGVSVSNDETYCLVTVGQQAQGCDLQTVHERSEAQWEALLGSARTVVLPALREAGDVVSLAGTRVWSAMECFFKCTGERATQVTLLSAHDGLVRLALRSERFVLSVATWPVQLTRGNRRVLALAEITANTAASVDELRVRPAESTVAAPSMPAAPVTQAPPGNTLKTDLRAGRAAK